MVQQKPQDIKYCGGATYTSSGLEVMAFHLHRFLVSWMHQHSVPEMRVALGFEQSQAPTASFHLGTQECHAYEAGWTFEDLVHVYRRGDSRLYVEDPKTHQSQTYVVLPLLDRPVMGGQAQVLLGFVLISDTHALRDAQTQELRHHVFEAVCAARRNSVRLFFDDHKSLDLKHLLYTFMAHLPEWTGVDHSTMLILTSTLETMTIQRTNTPQFNILAERLYVNDSSQRLVGMHLETKEDREHVLVRAFKASGEDPEVPYHVFVRHPTVASAWRTLDQDDSYDPIHHVEARSDESMYIQVPLRSFDEQDQELLGFLCLAYQQEAVLPSSVGQILLEISEHLSPLLRHSSIYTLSAKKLWILRQVRKKAERGVARSCSLQDTIEEISTLIQDHVDVPSVAMGYVGPMSEDQPQRVLNFVSPFGWADLSNLRLIVDMPEAQRPDSGVAALAVRLNQPLVLAGGHLQGAKVEFKNSVWVHERSGRLADERSHQDINFSSEEGWVPLAQYYKPACAQTYATLAYPVVFDDNVLGVIAVEVNKSTNWLWWTGFGGHFFWQLLASELANVFHMISAE